MKIQYLKREIFFADFLGNELPEDVKWILNYFKTLTHHYEKRKDGLETWFNKNGQWTIQIWEEKWKYSYFYYKNWDFLQEKCGLNYEQTSDLIHYLLELTLKRKVSTPSTDNLTRFQKLELTLKRKVSTPSNSLIV
mgnify:CR=1 FL=1